MDILNYFIEFVYFFMYFSRRKVFSVFSSVTFMFVVVVSTRLPVPSLIFSVLTISSVDIHLAIMFSPTRPSGPSWSESRHVHVCVCVSDVPFPCDFFRGLLLVLRSHDQIPAAVRCGAVQCGAVRCGAVRCGGVWCGAVRCGCVCGERKKKKTFC